MTRWPALAALLALAVPAAARKPACPPARSATFAALVRDAAGDVRVLLATIRAPLSTEDVACWASVGNRPMVAELARRLERGDGIAADVARAEQLYASVAKPVSGQTAIYVPGIMGQPGRVQLIRTGPDLPGLPEADYAIALLHLEGRAAKPNWRRGLKRLERLARAGYPPAVERLAAIRARRT